MVLTLATNFVNQGSVSANDELIDRAKEQQVSPDINLSKPGASKSPSDSAKK
jgi:hypothetical protein